MTDNNLIRVYRCYFCDLFIQPGTGIAVWISYIEHRHKVRFIEAAHSWDCINPNNYEGTWRLLTDTLEAESINQGVQYLKDVHRWSLGFAARDCLSNEYGLAWKEVSAELVGRTTFYPSHRGAMLGLDSGKPWPTFEQHNSYNTFLQSHPSEATT